MPPRTRRRTLPPALIAALAVVLVLVLGIWLGGRHPSWLPGFVRSPLVGDSESAVVREAIDDVSHTYYRKIPKSQLSDDAIGGVVQKLNDRFSNYFNPAEYQRFKLATSSEFSGIGTAVSQDPRGLKVEVVYDDSPAKRAGMLAGDVITDVGRQSLAGKRQEDSVALIKGPPGSDVRLTWIHEGKRLTKTLTRNTVEVPVVASSLKRQSGCPIGYVKLAQFSSGAHAEVYDALQRLRRRGAKAYIFDLRGNGGGLVSEAQLIASAFLKDGPIVTTKGRAVAAHTLDATGHPVIPNAPLVVLVDGGTASASEIVAGALQDRHRADLVGEKTFGKGVFQQVIELSNGGALDITAGQYFLPSGRNLGGKGVSQGAGLHPTVKAVDDPKTKNRDEGLDRGLQVAASKCP
jgi:carboxyl-terminal processing protease